VVDGVVQDEMMRALKMIIMRKRWRR